MDSSIVTRARRARSPGRLKAFTGAFHEGPEFDESRYAREVAAAHAAPSCIRSSRRRRSSCDLLPRLVYHMDEPVAGPGLLPAVHRRRALARPQVKVCLGGQGGDEIFGGYARYVVAYLEQALKGAIFETNEEQRAHRLADARSCRTCRTSSSTCRCCSQFWRDGVFEPMDRAVLPADRPERRRARASSATTSARTTTSATIFARFQSVFNHPDTLSYYNKMTHFDLVTSLPALLHVEDRVSMAVSLESRVPLLDPSARRARGEHAAGDEVPGRRD